MPLHAGGAAEGLEEVEMARVCTVCAHAERDAIDRALVAGESCASLAARYGTIGRMALARHKAAHLPALLAKAQEAEVAARGDSLLDQLEGLCAEAHRIKDKAERAADYRTALSGIRELVRIVELMAKVRGELAQEGTVNILVMPEWLVVRAAMLAALRPYREAGYAVAAALVALEAGDAGA